MDFDMLLIVGGISFIAGCIAGYFIGRFGDTDTNA